MAVNTENAATDAYVKNVKNLLLRYQQDFTALQERAEAFSAIRNGKVTRMGEAEFLRETEALKKAFIKDVKLIGTTMNTLNGERTPRCLTCIASFLQSICEVGAKFVENALNSAFGGNSSSPTTPTSHTTIYATTTSAIPSSENTSISSSSTTSTEAPILNGNGTASGNDEVETKPEESDPPE